MKSPHILLLVTLLLPQAYAVPEEKAPPPDVVKFIELKYLGNERTDRLNRVITMVQQLTRGAAQIVHDPVLHTVAISGSSEAVANAEQLMRRFDTPAAEDRTRQVQLSLYLVEATDQATTEIRIPAELTSALEQLQKAFGYKAFRLIDTIILQSREHSEFSISGNLAGTPDAAGQKTHYTAQYRSISYVEAQKAVYVNGLRFDMRVPILVSPPGSNNTQASFADSGIRTDLTIRDGQKLVLGKLTKDQGERGMFLIVSSKVD
jgi:type II secretory pathway component GspD/PulD (secretin)